MTVAGIIPGTTYVFQARAVGGSNRFPTCAGSGEKQEQFDGVTGLNMKKSCDPVKTQ